MGDHRRQDRVDPIDRKAGQIADMLDSGRQMEQAADALRAESYEMNPVQFKQLVTRVQQYERQNYGNDLWADKNGIPIIDTGNQQVVVATRDYDRHMQMAGGGPQQGQRDGRDGRYDGRGQQQNDRQGRGIGDAIGEGLLKGGLGAVIGGVVNGRDGAKAGAIAGVGDAVIDHATGGRSQTGSTAGDMALRTAVGAGIGMVVNGRKGAISGAAATGGISILDEVVRNRQRRY